MNRFIKWLLQLLNRRQGGTGEIVIVPPETPPETKLPPVVVSDTPATPAPETEAEPIDIKQVKWYGQSAANAKRVPAPALRNVRISGDDIRCDYDPMPDTWPTKNADNGKVLQGQYHLIYERDGGLFGGEFDKVTRPGQTVKTLDNIIKHGRHGHAMPAKGTPTYAMWTNLAMTERSAIVKVAWLLALCLLPLLSGCRTYYVWQLGTGDNYIGVDAQVEKTISPEVKASLK